MSSTVGSYDPMLEDGEEYFVNEEYFYNEDYLDQLDELDQDDLGDPVDEESFYNEDYYDQDDLGDPENDIFPPEDLTDFLAGAAAHWNDHHTEVDSDEYGDQEQVAHFRPGSYDGSSDENDNDNDIESPTQNHSDSDTESDSAQNLTSQSASESGSASASASSASASASASASSSPSAAASPESSQDQQDPPRHNRRQVSSAFGVNARASPRRPSLTPDIHPNRRLPRTVIESMHDQRRREHHLRQPVSSRNDNSHAGPSGRLQPHSRAAHRYSPVNDGSSDDVESETDQTNDDEQEQSSSSDSEQSSDQSSDQDTVDEEEEGSTVIIDDEDRSTLAESTEDEQQNDTEEENDEQRDDFWQIRATYLAQRREAVRERGRLAGQRRAGAARAEGMDGDDELIEVVYHHQHQPAPLQQRRQRQQGRQNHHPGPANAREPVHVIDLTEEPDSPVLQMNRPIVLPRQDHNNRLDLTDDNSHYAARHQRRNPRRQMSQSNGRTPALARSDGSVLGNAAPVIDLTSDSPDDEREGIPANRFLPPPVPQQQRNNRRSGVESLGRGLMGHLSNFNNLRDMILPRALVSAHLAASGRNDIEIIGAHDVGGINPNPLAGNPPDFNYQANGFGGFGGGRPATPKPDFEAPPAARPGFSRDTGNNRITDEEQVFVCPSCDNELMYAPEGDDGPRPAKRARTKKDREEHHFWAVKACGHVYCKNCYDNRKKHKDRNAHHLGFKFVSAASNRQMKTICAVNDCETDVSSNTAWVGIFM